MPRVCSLVLVVVSMVSVSTVAQAGPVEDPPSQMGIRTVSFAGLEWQVRAGEGGPGPNFWSDSEDSVWVDEQGRLHLVIRREQGTWYSSEVLLQEPLGYGHYQFQMETNVEALDPQVVVGLFTYLDDLNEIDIEFTRWGDPRGVAGHYTVQPYSTPGNTFDFELGLTGTHSTHSFDWAPDSIHYRSLHGHHDEPPTSDFVIQEWTYTGDSIPLAGQELVHLNFWMFQGQPPINGEAAELVVSDFRFEPADAPIRAAIESLVLSAGDFVAGSEVELEASDDSHLIVASVPQGSRHVVSARLDLRFESELEANDLDLLVELRAAPGGGNASWQLFDWEARAFVQIGGVPMSSQDSAWTLRVPAPIDRFVRGDGRVRVRLSARSGQASYELWIDEVGVEAR